MGAGIGQHDRIGRQKLRQRLHHLARMDVIGLEIEHRRVEMAILLDLRLRCGLDQRRQRCGQRRDCRLGIADDAVISRIDLADLGGGNVDVNELLAGQEIAAEIERRMLGEGIADRDHEIGGDEGLAGRSVAAVGEYAQRQRMVFGNDAFAVERRREGDLKAFDESLQLGPRAAPYRAEADQRDDRLAAPECVGNGGSSWRDRRRIGQDRLHLEPDIAVIVDRLPGQRQILGNMNVHRPRAALASEIDRLLQYAAGLADVVEQEGGFRGGREHRLRIRRAAQAGRLVQRAFAPPHLASETGDRQHRIGIRHRDREAGKQIEGAGPGGGEAHAQAIRINRVAAGHEGGGLLVARHHGPDFCGMLER